jgi:predicted AlkP superfamily phosphohydrolase/phosphomutase
MAPKLLIIGLDCAEPSLVFERWRDELPNLGRLIERGSYGRLTSCTPAITVPAWSCMMSGRDPGELGIYGFRNRVDRSYGNMGVADARAVRVPRLWDLLGEQGWRVAVVSVPGTFPPRPVNGDLIGCFLTPSTRSPYTYPPELAEEIRAWVGEYVLDVPNFRSEDKARIFRDIDTLCAQRFAVAEQLIASRDPDMLMLVDMGTDRIHHAAWKYMDPAHPLHEPGSPYAEVIHDYYCRLDARIGSLLARCDAQTAVLVVSDHGARPLMGGFCVNEWLIREGYLALKAPPAQPAPLERLEVDWSRTTAWGSGGYYGRIFLNVQGREPEGQIPLADYERFRAELARRIEALPGPDGQTLGNRAFTPQELYRTVRGIAPDLVVYFGDLAWRAVGTVGTGELYTIENDTGPDDANHAQQGLFIFADPAHPAGGKLIHDAEIYDVLPTLLKRYGIQAPEGLRGRVLDV